MLGPERTILPGGTRGVALTLLLAVSLVLGAAPEPLASGPRPPVSTYVGPSDAWGPPAPWVDHRFTTLPFTSLDGTPGTWVLTDRTLPLELTLEREIVDRFGLDRVRGSLEAWNDTDGSRFQVEVTHLADTRTDTRRRDGVNRVFLDRTTCGERYLARAHLYPAAVEVLDGRSVAWVEEVDVGICERLEPDRLATVLRHEIAHVAGLGHLCDADSDCWLPEMSEDNRCRVMSPAAYGCAEPAAGDLDGLVYMHPTVPRVYGRGAVATSAAAARVTDPRVQRAATVVLVPVTAEADLQMATAAYAGAVEAPLVLVDEDCTAGEDGRALNRLAAVAAHVVLAGDVPRGCEDQLRLGWELTTERLPDIESLTEALAGLGDGEQVVIVPRSDVADDDLPISALAAPVAARLRAPMVTVTSGGLDRAADALLDRIPEAKVAIVLGGAALVAGAVERDLEARGLKIRRIRASDRTRLAVAISRMRDVFGPDPIDAVLVPMRPSSTPAPAAALAARTHAAVLPVSSARHRQVLDPLARRVDRALLVAEPTEVSVGLQLTLSRIVDDD